MHLDSLRITGDDTDLHASGTAGVLDQDKELDCTPTVDQPEKLAQTIDPNITSSGRVSTSPWMPVEPCSRSLTWADR